MTDHEEMNVCEHCGHATSVASDVCPNCGEPMAGAGAKTKNHQHDDELGLDDEELLTDKEIAAGQDDGTVSLEAMRAEEEEDEPAYGSEYGNE